MTNNPTWLDATIVLVVVFSLAVAVGSLAFSDYKTVSMAFATILRCAVAFGLNKIEIK